MIDISEDETTTVRKMYAARKIAPPQYRMVATRDAPSRRVSVPGPVRLGGSRGMPMVCSQRDMMDNMNDKEKTTWCNSSRMLGEEGVSIGIMPLSSSCLTTKFACTELSRILKRYQ